MNNPSPLIPEGSVWKQKNKSRARLRVAVSAVLAIHFIGLMALLMQGCRKPSETDAKTTETNTPAFDTTNAPAVETNAPSTNTTYYVPPAPETNPPPAMPSAAQEYTIVKGDTFETIGKHFGVTTKAIENANPGVVPTKLKIGQKIQIPAPAASVSTPAAIAPAAADTSAGGEQTYKVKSGDTLTTIGKHFGVTVKALRSANNLTTDKIKVGDKLKIPAKTTAPVETTTPSAPAANNPKPL
jgi:LysM repeat protein